MQIIALLFQNSKQPLVQKRHLAQQKIAQLDQQLRIVGLICPKEPHLQPIKAKLQTERARWQFELQQAEAALDAIAIAPARHSWGDRLRHSGLPP